MKSIEHYKWPILRSLLETGFFFKSAQTTGAHLCACWAIAGPGSWCIHLLLGWPAPALVELGSPDGLSFQTCPGQSSCGCLGLRRQGITIFHKIFCSAHLRRPMLRLSQRLHWPMQTADDWARSANKWNRPMQEQPELWACCARPPASPPRFRLDYPVIKPAPEPMIAIRFRSR